MAKVLLYLFCLLLTCSIALACSCIQPLPPQESLDQATAVFVGKVTVIQPPFLHLSSTDPIKVTFDVSQVWKGEITKTTTIKTAQDSASCGYPFGVGEEYLVYASGEVDDLNTGLCTRTNHIANRQEDIEMLGTSTPPTQDLLAGMHPILRISLMGLSVLVIALILFRYKHKPKK